MKAVHRRSLWSDRPKGTESSETLLPGDVKQAITPLKEEGYKGPEREWGGWVCIGRGERPWP
jgi:hypothetical protein